MTKTAHVLELNGRRYDAMTGKLLADSNKPSHPSPKKSVDGFAQPATHHHATAPASAHHTRTTIDHHLHDTRTAVPHSVSPKPAPKVMDISRTGTHHTQPHRQQHSTTLMRHVVHAPNTSLKRRTKTAAHTGALVPAIHFDIMPKYSVNNVDKDRMKRAHTVARSKFISRFAVANSVTRPAAIPSQAPVQAPAPAAAHPAHQPSTDIFERALAAANSHKQPPMPVKHRTKKSHRLRTITSVTASTLAILLIVGFVAYQNVASIQLRLASSRAGIAATMPAWKPAGFSLGTFAYTPGTVTISYKSAVDPSRAFTITQTASNWNSATLLSDFVYPDNDTYNTITSGGNTLYMYGKNNATWVSNGIWYKLVSDGSLSTSQIVNIATSMQS